MNEWRPISEAPADQEVVLLETRVDPEDTGIVIGIYSYGTWRSLSTIDKNRKLNPKAWKPVKGA